MAMNERPNLDKSTRPLRSSLHETNQRQNIMTITRKRSYDERLSTASLSLDTKSDSTKTIHAPSPPKPTMSEEGQRHSKRPRHGQNLSNSDHSIVSANGPRLSKFLEADMTDPNNAGPPAAYFEQHDSSSALHNDAAKDENGVKRSSGFFRLSKSVATAFSSVFSWKPEHRRDVSESGVDPRKEEIWKAYQNLKKTSSDQTNSDLSLATPTPPTSSHTDGDSSGKDLDSKRSSRASWVTTAESNERRSVDVSDPKMSTQGIRNSLLKFKKPSLSNLRRARSETQLRSPETEDAPPVPPIPEPLKDEKAQQQQRTLRKKVSRKDIHRQQKLTKKVSDLESKLELARRELQEAINGDVPPVPDISDAPQSKLFAPSLPSLPSERFFSKDQSLVPNPMKGADAAPVNSLAPRANVATLVDTDVEMADPSPAKEHVLARKRKSEELRGMAAVDPEPEMELSPQPKLVNDQQTPTASKRNSATRSRLVTKGRVPLYSPPPANRTSGMDFPAVKRQKGPVEMRSKIPRRSVSPAAQASPFSIAMSPAIVVEEESEVSEREDEIDNVPPLPRIPSALNRLMMLGKKEGGEGADSGSEFEADETEIVVEREEYQWDDDIF